MKSKMTTKLAGLVLIAALVIGGVVSPTGTNYKAHAAQKAYCAGLKLNNDIKLNTKKTYTKTGVYQEKTFYKNKKNIKINYTIQSSRKSEGKNYKVTYKVNYKFLNDAKLDSTEITYDDWYWGFTQPHAFYTVFDYQTGKSLEAENKLGVKVKGSEWKYTYYPKQNYKYKGSSSFVKQYKGKDLWIRNPKTISCSFTVTYPKTCKNVCVGIGFSNMLDNTFNDKNRGDNRYWNGKIPYGKTLYYQKGKNTMSYMRLN